MTLLFRIYSFLGVFALGLPSYAQIVPNASFEGPPQENVPPEHWTPCHEFSTPDTQPGFWEVTKGASDGDTYIGLVTRGNLGPFANNNEDIEVRLATPLIQGVQYPFRIYLALSENWGHDIDFGATFLRYDTPAKLQVFGASSSCNPQELLWESPTIDHTDWRSYTMILTPQNSDAGYLFLQANYVDGSTYFGNVLVDNISECSIEVDWVSDTTICEHRPWMVDVTVPDATYIWQDGSTNPVFSISEAGTYSVEITNACISEVFEVDVATRNCFCDTAVPIQTKSFDTLLCEQTPLLIDAETPDGLYVWSNGSTESSITVDATGLYSVQVSNLCETETFEYLVQTKSCNCEVSAPNAFSPNGDGINEFFEITGTPDIARYNLKVFNRAGKVVYQSNELLNFWDGKINGRDLPAGPYYWSVTLSCIQGNSIVDNFFKGPITILR